MKKIRHVIRTDYLDRVYSKKYLTLIPRVLKKAQQIRAKTPFDAIAFTGSSGAAVAYPLSFLLKVPLIHIRKKDGNHYGGGKIEGTISSQRYLIVDDFINTGKTIKRIEQTIREELGKSAKPVAILTYASSTRSSSQFDIAGKNIPVFPV